MAPAITSILFSRRLRLPLVVALMVRVPGSTLNRTASPAWLVVVRLRFVGFVGSKYKTLPPKEVVTVAPSTKSPPQSVTAIATTPLALDCDCPPRAIVENMVRSKGETINACALFNVW